MSESQKLMSKLERKAQRRAAGKAGGGGAAVKDLGDEDADWVRWVGRHIVGLSLHLAHISVCFETAPHLCCTPQCRCLPGTWSPFASVPPAPLPRSAYGLMPLVEEEMERETAHQRLRCCTRARSQLAASKHTCRAGFPDGCLQAQFSPACHSPLLCAAGWATAWSSG